MVDTVALTMLLKMVTCLTKTQYNIVNTKERQRQKIPQNLEANLPIEQGLQNSHKGFKALRLEKVLPTIISPNQTGYVKGRYKGESIRIITDKMSFTEKKIFQA